MTAEPATIQCSSCKSENPLNARFCNSCGTAIPAIPPPSLPTTPNPVATSTIFKWSSTLNRRHAIVSFICALFLLVVFRSCKSPSVEEHLATVIQTVNAELNQPGCDFGKQIETSHLTVRYKGGNVTSMSAKTLDGSARAGRNGSNISEITMLITAHWEGKIQATGFTEVEIVYDNVAKKIKSSRHVKSNAIIDLETVDWVKVGYMIGAAVASSAFN